MTLSFSKMVESDADLPEQPFYQGLAALEMFERAIKGKDIATGFKKPSPGYFTQGSKESTYREGNSTIQFSLLPSNATYPPPNPSGGSIERRSRMSTNRPPREMLSHAGKKFKP